MHGGTNAYRFFGDVQPKPEYLICNRLQLITHALEKFPPLWIWKGSLVLLLLLTCAANSSVSPLEHSLTWQQNDQSTDQVWPEGAQKPQHPNANLPFPGYLK